VLYRIESAPPMSENVSAQRREAAGLRGPVEARYRALAINPDRCDSPPDWTSFVYPAGVPAGFQGAAALTLSVNEAGVGSAPELGTSSSNSDVDKSVVDAALKTKYRYAPPCNNAPSWGFYSVRYDPGWPSDVAPSVYPDCEENAKVLIPVSPKYPGNAQDLDTGPVSVHIRETIDTSGAVSGATVIQSSNVLSIDRSALQAAMNSVYAPARHLCKPVTREYVFVADFDLGYRPRR
jgi:TonB family protein